MSCMEGHALKREPWQLGEFMGQPTCLCEVHGKNMFSLSRAPEGNQHPGLLILQTQGR